MIVGGSWGATLALAYAQAHPERITGIVLRATFLGTRREIEDGFLDVLPRTYPALYEDFLNVLPAEERKQPIDAYFRRIRCRFRRAQSRGTGLGRDRAHSFRTHAEPL